MKKIIQVEIIFDTENENEIPSDELAQDLCHYLEDKIRNDFDRDMNTLPDIIATIKK